MENKKLSKRERKKILWTRIICAVLAALMVGGMAYYIAVSLFSL